MAGSPGEATAVFPGDSPPEEGSPPAGADSQEEAAFPVVAAGSVAVGHQAPGRLSVTEFP